MPRHLRVAPLLLRKPPALIHSNALDLLVLSRDFRVLDAAPIDMLLLFGGLRCQMPLERFHVVLRNILWRYRQPWHCSWWCWWWRFDQQPCSWTTWEKGFHLLHGLLAYVCRRWLCLGLFFEWLRWL